MVKAPCRGFRRTKKAHGRVGRSLPSPRAAERGRSRDWCAGISLVKLVGFFKIRAFRDRGASIINTLAKNNPGKTVSEDAKHEPDGINNQHSDCDKTPAIPVMHEGILRRGFDAGLEQFLAFGERERQQDSATLMRLTLKSYLPNPEKLALTLGRGDTI